jgi:hypothetical protein
MNHLKVTEHTVKSGSHATFYLAAGPLDGPLIVFVHGWPELAISWRHQLPTLAALGFRAIAPDMRVLRHMFRRQCRECGIPKDIHDAITGHPSAGRGGPLRWRVPLKPLADAMRTCGIRGWTWRA